MQPHEAGSHYSYCGLTPFNDSALVASIQNFRTAAHWLSHSDQVIAQMNLTQRYLIDEETGVRGFLLNREENTLSP